MKNSLVIFAYILLLFSSASYAEKLRVGFLCPAPETNPFWGSMVNVMRAAAKDLNIELIVNCSKHASLAAKRAGDALLESDPPLDYFITGYWEPINEHHLVVADSKGIKTFIINSRIERNEWEKVGEPRGKLKNWIGHMVPNDKKAAIDLTKALVDKTISASRASDEIEVAALLGNGMSTISRDRADGLRMQLKGTPKVKLYEMSLGDQSQGYWSAGWTTEDVDRLLQEHPGLKAIWAGNQGAMWVAVQGVEQAGKVPGKDVFIAGFDWNQESIHAIADGRISVSMFGHFLEGVWALILVHDYHYGFDFKDDTGVSISTPLTVMTPENVAQYKNILDKDFWNKVDFRKLSKKYNAELKSYNFNISQFLNLSASSEN